jgi:hypothetical protein
MLSRIFWIALPYLIIVEVFSVMPLRVPQTKNRSGVSPPFLTGAVHLPVGRGDLGKKLDRIAAAARNAGLDFLVLANQDKVFPESAAGSRGGVDLFTEMEATTPAGHALYFYSHTTAAGSSAKKLKEMAWRHFLGTETHKGAFLVVAHPSSVFAPWERLDRFPDGIELINLRSLVERQAFDSPLAFALTIAVGPFNPYLSALRLFDPVARDLRGWDAVNEVSPGHFGLVATDDLSDWPMVDRTGFAIPPWETTLKVASNVVFPDGPVAASFADRRAQIYRALEQGRSALLFHAVHPFEGNDWSLSCGGKTYRSGDKFALRVPGCEFVVKLPPTLKFKRKIVLLRDGAVAAEINSAKDEERIPVDQDGAYRLEVWVKESSAMHLLLDREIPYLFYNPLYVR